jgi:hypothetical protein
MYDVNELDSKSDPIYPVLIIRRIFLSLYSDILYYQTSSPPFLLFIPLLKVSLSACFLIKGNIYISVGKERNF